MPKRKSNFAIATKWMQDGKPCIYGKGQICFWIESNKECQKCMKEYRENEIKTK